MINNPNFQQISLFNTYNEVSYLAQSDKIAFLELLSKHVDISKAISASFYYAYNKQCGKNRDFSLSSMLSALLLQKLLGIPYVSLLRTFLRFSRPARIFCGLTRVPNDSQFSRFKTLFHMEIKELFDSLVDWIIPICKEIDNNLAAVLIYDTSGIEPKVKENNPKFINSMIRQFKQYSKLNPGFDPYRYAYSQMPSHAQANQQFAQMHINGTFCYALKFGILTNGLGIPLNVTFLDDDFKDAHPHIEFQKKTDSPDEDKTLGDNKSLKPILSEFLSRHSEYKPHTFLGDAAFDSMDNYRLLLNELKFKSAVIPLNTRRVSGLAEPGLNESGHPLCPNDPTLPMKYEGSCTNKHRLKRDKWICPKVAWKNRKRVCQCENPCTTSSCGRMFYTYPEKNLRAYPGIIRDTDEWIALYKTRTITERSINLLKSSMHSSDQSSLNVNSLKSDVYLSAIAQLLTVILAKAMNEQKMIRATRKLIRKIS